MNIGRLLLTFLLLGTPVWCAYALKQDRDQPLKINANSVSMNEKSGISTYRGNVVLIQGSMRVNADFLEIRSRGFGIETLTATGRPVKLRALLDDREGELTISGHHLVIQAITRELDFSGEVSVRQGRDEFSAEHVHYSLDNGHFSATGGDNGDGRIYAIIQPEKKKP